MELVVSSGMSSWLSPTGGVLALLREGEPSAVESAPGGVVGASVLGSALGGDAGAGAGTAAGAGMIVGVSV
tara:strand:+ start:276 stop:488 length:213 start_codon:yes stop_codon:yes gene_type:complete